LSDAFDKMLRDRGEKVPERPPVVTEESGDEPPRDTPAPPAEPKADTPAVAVQPAISPGTAPAVSNDLPPMDTLKEQILGSLRKVRHSLAATMEKAEQWAVNGDTLVLTFRSTFEKSFLEKERHEIEKIILESLNYRLQLDTQLRKREEQSTSHEVEEQVELVRSVFRGTIVKRSES
jgi:hypothetical protein